MHAFDAVPVGRGAPGLAGAGAVGLGLVGLLGRRASGGGRRRPGARAASLALGVAGMVALWSLVRAEFRAGTGTEGGIEAHLARVRDPPALQAAP